MWNSGCPEGRVSAHRDSALGGEREEGPLQTERPSLYSCLCHKDELQNLCKALMCEMGVFMLALTTPWNVCENLHLSLQGALTSIILFPYPVMQVSSMTLNSELTPQGKPHSSCVTEWVLTLDFSLPVYCSFCLSLTTYCM